MGVRVFFAHFQKTQVHLQKKKLKLILGKKLQVMEATLDIKKNSIFFDKNLQISFKSSMSFHSC